MTVTVEVEGRLVLLPQRFALATSTLTLLERFVFQITRQKKDIFFDGQTHTDYLLNKMIDSKGGSRYIKDAG